MAGEIGIWFSLKYKWPKKTVEPLLAGNSMEDIRAKLRAHSSSDLQILVRTMQAGQMKPWYEVHDFARVHLQPSLTDCHVTVALKEA